MGIYSYRIMCIYNRNALYIVNTTVVPGAYGDSYYGKTSTNTTRKAKLLKNFSKPLPKYNQYMVQAYK